jgi:DNA ligase-1
VSKQQREFLMLAHDYEPKRVAHWTKLLISEKFDGMRGLWLPSTRGKIVPFSRSGHRISTGLWSRYGHVIDAPKWWLDSMPPYAVDGELYAGRGQFQFVMSVCRTQAQSEGYSTERWRRIKYNLFDAPTLGAINTPGKVATKTFKAKDGTYFYWDRIEENCFSGGPFEMVIDFLKPFANEVVVPVQYQMVKVGPNLNLDDLMGSIIAPDAAGEHGEGIMVRGPGMWEPTRSYHCLKLKRIQYAVVSVLGTSDGTKGITGMVGALKCTFEGRPFSVGTGLDFPDRERFQINPPKSIRIAYRELTDAGVPKDARYLTVVE